MATLWRKTTENAKWDWRQRDDVGSGGVTASKTSGCSAFRGLAWPRLIPGPKITRFWDGQN
jgi:hypothetical protein